MSTLATLIILSLIAGIKAENDDVDPNSVVVLLFMFIGLTVCLASMHILTYYNDIVPYTVVVFLLGVVFSGIADANNLSSFGSSLDQWVGINANLVLYVFLPVLIFGEAMNLNWHHVKGALFQSFMLAGPGVVIGALLTAAIVKGIIPYDWSWNLCLTFGAILSATDPVAVVALLKDAGAAPKLTILIVGESLMNDGSAMVLFTLFYNMLQGSTYNAGEIILFFLKAAIGSPVLGMICGGITIRWLRAAHRPLKDIDVTIQILITIICAYLVFFLAQYTFEISGVLACCGAGIILCWLAPPLILNHETMHNIWTFIEWMANTLIFLIAGLIMGHRTLQHVTGKDWGIMIAIYLLLMVIRVIVIAVLFPVVSKTGHKCTMIEAVFVAWSGLRGALAIALALIVENNSSSYISETEGSRFLFYIGGVAALTIIINGTFAQTVLLKLGLIGNDGTEKDLIMEAIRKRLRRKVNTYITNMETVMTQKETDALRESCSLFRNTDDFVGGFLEKGVHMASVSDVNNPLNNDANRLSKTVSGSIDYSNVAPLTAPSPGLDPANRVSGSATPVRFMSLSRRGPNAQIIPHLLEYVRCVFLELCRVRYWHMIENGKIPRTSHSATFLLYTIDVGIDTVKSGVVNQMADWDVIERHLEKVELYITLTEWAVKVLPKALALGYFTNLLAFFLARREKRSVYVLTSFIEAHEKAQEKIHAFLGGSDEDNPGMAEAQATPEELLVKQESMRAVEKAKAVLALFAPSTVEAIKTKQRQHMLLAKEVDLIKEMVAEGLLSNKNAEAFIEEITQDSIRVEQERNQLTREQAEHKKEIITFTKETRAMEQMSFAVRPSMTNNMRPSTLEPNDESD